MTEADAIAAVDSPLSRADLAADLRDLGLAAGDTVLVHASLSELGWVAGGPQAVVEALQQVLTESGTLVMPTHSTQYSNPTFWSNPPVPDDWPDQIREAMPPFRPEVTPTRSMGAVAECFRDFPGAQRSRHPECSFAAWGSASAAVVENHPYDDYLGDGSPLAEGYDRNGRVLMLGTDWETNTSLHLAEHRAALDAERVWNAAPVLEDGDRTMVEYETQATRTDDFADLGSAYEDETGVLARGTVGAGEATVLDQVAVVDYAVEWFETNR